MTRPNRENVDGLELNRAASDQGYTVLLCDPTGDRRDRISGIIREAQGYPLAVEGICGFDLTKVPSGESVALVALGSGCPPSHDVLEAISQCKLLAIRVIAFEDGVKQWPVRSKCLPLVAGAVYLLDSRSAGFACELRGHLIHEFQALAEKQRGQQELGQMIRRHGMVGESVGLLSSFRSAIRFSELSDLPVLITGESGTGKELMARAIARMDRKRSAGPFVTINCAAVSRALMESEFFGHRRGAFTGAERDRKGLIRAADGGVLFLDEIGDLDIALQGKLLRVLQENRVLSVGEEQEMTINVRFMAATNQKLEQLVAEGRFRGDLLHRLRVLLIHIPPLRERPADLPPLIRHFVEKYYGHEEKLAVGISQDFLEAVRQLELQGNVRQLENVIRQSLVNHHNGSDLDLNDLPADVLTSLTTPRCDDSCERGTFSQGSSSGPLSQGEMNDLAKQILDTQSWKLSSIVRECEKYVLKVVLERTRGNQSQAARLLGITARTLYNKLREYQGPIRSQMCDQEISFRKTSSERQPSNR